MQETTGSIVECHSGFAYAERPVALTWQGKRLGIAAILEQARIPAGRRFHIRTQDGQEFELVYREATDEWEIHQP
jgi:hypothetical protein